jgi:type IX secretion system PorP/SprF family membrane protein
MKHFSRITFLLVSVIAFLNVKAQQPINYNLYTLNPFMLNPAYTGDGACLQAFVNNHNRWINLDGAPTVFTFGAHNRFKNNTNLGLMVTSDNRTFVNFLNANLSYAYNVKLNKSQELTLGLRAGMASNGINTEKLGLLNPNDPLLQNFNSTRFDFGFGATYVWNRFRAGASIPHFFDPSGEFSSQFNANASYDFYTKNNIWKLNPMLMIRNYREAGMLADLMVLATWQEKFNAQLGYRTDKSMIAGFGVNWKTFNLAYAYQYHLGSDYRTFSPSGTHEIQLGYRLCRNKQDKQDINAEKIKVLIFTIDEKYSNPVSGNILITKANKAVYSGNADSRGISQIFLEPGIYEININAKGYLPIQELLDISGLKKGSMHEYRLNSIKLEKGLIFKYKSINFETASDKLMSSSFNILDKMSEILKDYPQMVIEVAGHTDNVGDDNDNLKLSERRAAAVVSYLSSKGVKSEQMKAIGYGETQPIADNNTPEGRLQNRRVMFTILEF